MRCLIPAPASVFQCSPLAAANPLSAGSSARHRAVPFGWEKSNRKKSLGGRGGGSSSACSEPGRRYRGGSRGCTHTHTRVGAVPGGAQPRGGLWPHPASPGGAAGVMLVWGRLERCRPGERGGKGDPTCPRIRRAVEVTQVSPGTGEIWGYGSHIQEQDPCRRCLLPSATSGETEQSPTALHLISRPTRNVCKAFSPQFSAKSLRVKLKNPQRCPRVGISRRLLVIFSCLISGAWCKLVQNPPHYTFKGGLVISLLRDNIA